MQPILFSGVNIPSKATPRPTFQGETPYIFNQPGSKPGTVIRVPKNGAQEFADSLRPLISKINQNEYHLQIDSSPLRKGVKFRKGIEDAWILKGKVEILPKDPQAKISKVVFSRHGLTLKSRVTSVAIHIQNGPVLLYESKGPINNGHTLQPLIECISQKLAKQLNGESDYSSDLLKNLEF